MCKKSESINKLAIALVKAQSEITSISKDSENTHFKSKYATLNNIIDETRPILAKNGLAILQMPGGDGENVIMKTMILHESGEWMETEPLVMRPVKNDPQGMGSCITYARRYSYSALLSISTEEDDDGNASSHAPNSSYIRSSGQSNNNTRQQSESPKQAPAASSNSVLSDVISDGQIKLIAVEKNKQKLTNEQYGELLEMRYNVTSTKQLTKKQATDFISHLKSLAV